MRSLARAGLAALATGALTTAFAGAAAAAGAATPRPPAQAAGHHHGQHGEGAGVVFVQTDGLAGNAVVAYNRSADGTLTQAGTYATGGLGGQLAGSVVDHLASQGSLAYSPATGSLYAVNAGSNTVSVFSVRGDQLVLRQVVSSGGTFPVSIAVRGHLVYVVNALAGGSVQGYVSIFGELLPLPGSNRALGLDPSATPQFVNTPGQAAFSPDGSQLIVTTKANGDDVDVFGVGLFGELSATPVVNAEPGTVPFGIAFDHSGHVVIAEAGTDALETFSLARDGVLTAIDTVGNGQAATCWVSSIGDDFYTSNAGSADVSGYSGGPQGQLALLGETATDAGTVDSAATPGGHFFYVQAGAAGIVDEYQVGAGGSLSEVGTVTVPGAAGGEGIVAL
jgi:DNA-binding beta-propeller fold protein YncE